MFSKQYKLPPYKIPLVLKLGKSFYSLHFKLVKMEQQKGNCKQKSKYGLIISKKIFKKAVTRNKLKRQMRKIIIDNTNLMKNGYNVLILVKKNVITNNFKLIKNELLNIFNKAKLLK